MDYPIVLLHGWGAGSKHWGRVKSFLENRGYKVFSPDLPGFGQNPPPNVAWNIDNYREWVRKYCEDNNLPQVFLLGHSFGGSVAVKFTVKYPDKVQKLVL